MENNKPTFGKQVFTFFHKLTGIKSFKSIVSSFACIGVGLLLGYILMLCLDVNHAGAGIGTLLTYGFSSKANFSRVLYQATPMMLTGLAIAFSFQLGLFNIGVTGQLTAGAFVSIIMAISGCNWFLCLLTAGIVGAIVGFIPGILKAKFNVNEVLSGIMLNWIVYYIIGIIGQTSLSSKFKDKTVPSNLVTVPEGSRIPEVNWFGFKGVTVAIFIAIAILILFQVILHYTKFGFELKLSGSNKDAAKYAGINQTKNIILSMVFAGFFAGLAGFIIYATGSNIKNFRWDAGNNTLISDGFNGISVSLIAQNSPIGCFFAAIFLALIDVAQTPLKGISDAYNIHYTELIKSIIIYAASISSFIIMILEKFHSRNANNKNLLDWSKHRKAKEVK